MPGKPQLIGIHYAALQGFVTVLSSQRLYGDNQMNKATALIDEIFQALTNMLRYAGRLIGRMSPPALLGAALVLAFLFSILPLALVLFVALMLIKVAVGACVVGGRRAKRAQEHVE
jgi:hypothetical protein